MSDFAAGSGRPRSLAEAQQRLLALRAEHQRRRQAAGDPPAISDPRTEQPQAEKEWKTEDGQRKTENRPLPCSGAADERHVAGEWQELARRVQALPDHLGWGSAAQTAVLRAIACRAEQQQANRNLKTENGKRETHSGGDRGWLDDWQQKVRTELDQRRAHERAQPWDDAPRAAETVALAPSLGLALLKGKAAAPGRLWLLLRALDQQGRGVLELADVRRAFTADESPLRFCGARRLRGLLAQGDGRFWTRSGARLWLRSAARVAHSLGVQRFKGRHVAVPVTDLTGGMAQVRAQLYAAFHSGRAPAPISRRTVATLSGVAERTQRNYDRRSGVARQRNFAQGPALKDAAAKEIAWQQGPASFVWTERRSKQRRLAWQLPNSYHGPHARLGRAGRKRHNKALADLLTLGTAGNGQRPDDGPPRRFFVHARSAARQIGRLQEPVYWPAPRPGLWLAHHPAALEAAC